MLEVIIATGIIAALLLYIALKLDDKHQIVKVLSLFFVVFFIFFLGKFAYDSKEVCELKPFEETQYYVYGNNFTGYHWDYTYSGLPASVATTPQLFHHNKTISYKTICYNTTISTTPAAIFKATSWYFRVIFLYVFGFLIWLSFKWFQSVIPKK